MDRATSCYLKTQNGDLKSIFLPDNTPIVIGRCPETDIQDSKCSRQQVRVCANYAEYTVSVQQIGLRASGLNGNKIFKGVKHVAKHSDHLEVLYGKHQYIIEFIPAPPETLPSRRRSHEFESVKDSQKVEFHNKMQKLEHAVENNGCKSSPVKVIPNSPEKKLSPGKINNLNKITPTKPTGDASKESWENFDGDKLLIYTAANVKHSSKIAAYDMDGTLIKTKSGLVLPKDCSDWQLLYPTVPAKLRSLLADQYKIVIFTNQAQIGAGKLKISDFKFKVENVVKKIGVPIQVFIATSKTIYRKPCIGMWQTLETVKNGDIAIEMTNSFYVGDAAGRQKNWAPGKRKDHSSADRLLAFNLKLKFLTPEEHFLGHKPIKYVLPVFNPRSFSENTPICDGSTQLISSTQEMILMVGCPGSGKSHFVKRHLKSYERVNRDTLGSWQKCIKEVEKHLALKRSVVVDNTHGDRDSRLRYIEIAKKHGIPVRCFVMAATLGHCKHNNKFRELTDPTHMKISDIVIHSYAKNYITPSLEEGFTEIASINFVPNFDNDDERKLYTMYLLER